MDYDFSGWATKNDIKCADGRTIRRDAFAHCDGKIVPLVWNHSHGSADNVLGHALLENRPEGVYAYCSFNDTDQGNNAKQLVQHGDITSLSIYANKLRQKGGDVLHGVIREVSLVLAGANEGAYIDYIMAHGDTSNGDSSNDEAEICMYGEISLDNGEISLQHAEENEDEKEEPKVAQQEKTVQDVFDTLNEEQKTVVYALIGQALEDAGADNEEGDEDMKHNAFEDDYAYEQDYLTHSDEKAILQMAKQNNVGSLQRALEIYADENSLSHDAIASGFSQDDGNIDLLFPEYKDLRPGAPELITNDQGWISVVMSKVHKSPISRIRTRQVDIRNIEELRAKGYKKGKQKGITGNFKLVRRSTDPQTIYVKNALHRDDIVDITDFDYAAYLYNIDKMMLNEELATAIMLGDGRDDGDENKIDPTHIRPIWTDDDLYTLHVDLDIAGAKKELQGTGTGASFGDNYVTAEAMINTVLYAREKFKGSGTPDFYCTPHMLNVMLLARDMNGRRIYSSKSELATALNVNAIHTAEQFEGKTRTTEDAKTKKLVGIICNLADYSLGATKGGELTHFTQFDIDFNQEKSLLETRCSGALTRVYSAIAIEEDVTESV